MILTAQNVLDTKLDGSEEGKSLSTVLSEIERNNGARFYYINEWFDPISFGHSYKGQSLGEAMENLFIGTDLSYLILYSHAIVFIKDPTQAILRKNAFDVATKEGKKIEPFVFGEMGKSKKGNVTIRGRVIDAKTKQAIPQINIQISDVQRPSLTDEKGNYVLTLTPGLHILTFGFVEYESKVIDLAAYDDGEINIDMDEKSILLDEVLIQDNTSREVTTSRLGLTQLQMKEIKRAPAMLGEVDLVKQIQNLPGVTTVGEAASGFNVRGGSVDQNLILYDGLPVFNSSHVFGFFSTFNSEAVRDVSFYRGGIPAEFGGRASSVLDIQSKDGDYKKWGGNIGIGMITGNLMINGPIKRDKTSIAASFRSTYSNWLIHSIKTDYADLGKASVGFYDATLKLTHLINEHNKLSITGYASNDSFRLVGDSTYSWSNLQLSAKLDHQLSEKWNSEFIAGISSYAYSVVNADYLTASELSYRITTSVAKGGFIYQAGMHKVNLGMQFIHYQFEPGTLTPGSPVSNAKYVSVDKQYSIENALYIGDEWIYSEKLLIEAGLRIPMFASFGPSSLYTYKEGIPREITNLTDTLHYSSFQPVKFYIGVEPRLSFRLKTSSTGSIKLGYNRMYQYLHLVTNTTAVTPVDIWQPSGYYFKPQRADQISIGYFKDLRDKKYSGSIEGFYKIINNILDFKDGAQLILNKHLETDLLQGTGRSYGIETSVSRNTGRLQGTLNYTYSRSFRTIAGPTASESVNSGKEYASSYDQPHILNLSWKYALSRRHFFSGNFTYHTGRPVTIPLSAFQLENTTVAYFSERNQYRIPDYHRLDLALVIEGNHKRKKWADGTWVISVYNVYGRANPYTVFFKSSGTGIPQPYQLSIIGTALPSVSYNLKF